MNKQEVMSLFVDDIQSRKDSIRTFIQDKSNSYEDRLEVWLNTPDHLTTNESSIATLTSFEKKYGEIDWFDDFFYERHETVDLRDVVSYLRNPWDDEKLRAFYSSCMDEGIHSFTLDW